MQSRRSWLTTAAAVVMCIAPVLIAAQGGQTSTRRTAWGDPDLQGIWVINQDTPLERPDPKLDAARLGPLVKWFPGGESGLGGLAGVNEPLPNQKKGPRLALVVSPPTGRIPMRPAAEAKRDYNLTHLTDSYVNHTLWERCITRGPVLLPSNYNNGYEILQVPGYVAILHEMIHEYRLIPLDGRPRVDNVRQWTGDPRGRWEGQTLVVETTNFRAGTILASSTKSLALRGVPHGEALRRVERFSLLDDRTLNYELVVDDADTYTSPWKVAFPIDREQNYRIFEYACHEGNYGLVNTLTAARAGDVARR